MKKTLCESAFVEESKKGYYPDHTRHYEWDWPLSDECAICYLLAKIDSLEAELKELK